MFWWYWSIRQRLLLLAAVLLPVGGFFVFAAVLGDGRPAAKRPAVTAPGDEDPEAAVPQSEMLVLASDDSRSAASIFPATFGGFSEASVQTTNMVLPGQAFDEYSVYLFFQSFAPEDAAIPSVTTVPGEVAPTTVPAAEGAAPAVTLAGTTVESVRESLRWYFNERGALARKVESRSGSELFVAGLESGRGYQGTLRFQAVPGGVVVRGLVVVIPANEVADVIAESQTASGAPASAEGPPVVGSTPAGGDDPAESPAASTVPPAPTTNP